MGGVSSKKARKATRSQAEPQPQGLPLPLSSRDSGLNTDTDTRLDCTADLRRLPAPAPESEPDPQPQPDPEPEPAPPPPPPPPPQPAPGGALRDLLQPPRPWVCMFPRHRLIRVASSERRVQLPELREPGPPYAVWLSSTDARAADVLPWAVRASGTDQGALVGRVFCSGALLPARIDPNMFCAFVGWEGDVAATYTFEVLVVVRGNAEWLAASEGDVPAQAFPVGLGVNGETTYTARVFTASRWHLGRVTPNEDGCVIVDEGEELMFSDYEVLTITP